MTSWRLKSSKTLFALRVLRAHGMPVLNLWDIAKAILVPQVMYALSLIHI